MVYKNNNFERKAVCWWYGCTPNQATYYLIRISETILTEILKSYVSYCRSNNIRLEEEK